MLTASSALMTLWQLHASRVQLAQIDWTDRQMTSVLNVDNDVLRYVQVLQDAIRMEDLNHMKAVMEPLQRNLSVDVRAAAESLGYAESANQDQAVTASLLSYFDVMVPNEIETVTALAQAGDWQAAKLRTDKDLTDKSAALAKISNDIETAGRTERQAALAKIESSRVRVLTYLLLCGLLSIAVACLLGLTVTRSISLPLGELKKGAAALRAGDLAHRIPEDGADDLTLLSAAFNTAAASIQESHATLERRVAERTAQLATACEVAEAASRGKKRVPRK